MGHTDSSCIGAENNLIIRVIVLMPKVFLNAQRIRLIERVVAVISKRPLVI